MGSLWTVVGGLLVTAVIVVSVFAVGIRRHVQRTRLRVAKELLHLRREWLEAKFLSLASASGKPRSLVWAGCDFDDAVAYARDRQSGQLRALVGMSITFALPDDEVLEEPGLESSRREATAVFRFDGAQWTTDGRAVFNLNPTETIRRFGHELELVE